MLYPAGRTGSVCSSEAVRVIQRGVIPRTRDGIHKQILPNRGFSAIDKQNPSPHSLLPLALVSSSCSGMGLPRILSARWSEASV